jgi:hypothetical protein
MNIESDRRRLKTAIELSRLAPPADSHYAVGAVIADANDNVLATGYTTEGDLHNLGGQGHRGRDEHGGRTGRLGGGHVTADVTHHDAAVRGHTQIAGGRGDQARRGFATAAAGRVVVRADLPGVERPEQVFDPPVHGVQLLGGEPATGHAGLVGDHAEAQAGGAQPVQRSPGAGHRHDPGRITVVRHIHDQRAVPIEKDGVEQRVHRRAS